MRLGFGKRLGLMRPDQFVFTWVVDFPLLEWDETEKRYVSMHHPFTSPIDDDLPKMDTDPGKVRAKAYDLVLNGSEIGGGSIRIHDTQLQARIFRLLNISDEEATHALRVLPRGARVRHAAAWRDRPGPRPHRARSSRARTRSARSSRSPRRPPPST